MKKILITVIAAAGFFNAGFSQNKGLSQSNGEPQSTVTSAEPGKINDKPATMEEKLKASGITDGQLNDIGNIQKKYDESLAKLNNEKKNEEEKEKSLATISQAKENSLKKALGEDGYRKYQEIATNNKVEAKNKKVTSVKTKTVTPEAKAKTKTTTTKKGKI